jgi:hypothetical protein
VPTYLESSAVVNVPYYKKYGFDFVKEIHLERGEKPISLGIMVREPKSSVGSSSSKSKTDVSTVETIVG